LFVFRFSDAARIYTRMLFSVKWAPEPIHVS